jgi:hypothetical protein
MGSSPLEPIPRSLETGKTWTTNAKSDVRGAQSGGHDPFIGAMSDATPFDVVELGSIGIRAYAVLSVQRLSGIVKVQIFHGQSGELIREIHPDELLQIAAQAQAYSDVWRRHGR